MAAEDDEIGGHPIAKGAIEKLFAPEFRNRLSAIVTFDPLPFEAMELIVSKFVFELEAQLRERKVAITLTDEARGWLARKGYDPKFGARPVSRIIQEHVRDPLTDEILFGSLENGGHVEVGFDGKELQFTFSPSASMSSASPMSSDESSSSSGDTPCLR